MKRHEKNHNSCTTGRRDEKGQEDRTAEKRREKKDETRTAENGLEIKLEGLSISFGRAGWFVLAGGIAAILYAVAVRM
jgi:hypothetical protein